MVGSVRVGRGPSAACRGADTGDPHLSGPTTEPTSEPCAPRVEPCKVPWFHYQSHFADVFPGGGFDIVMCGVASNVPANRITSGRLPEEPM
jgi:hypothetical protein